jgi:hypothetical protein
MKLDGADFYLFTVDIAISRMKLYRTFKVQNLSRTLSMR